MPVEPEPEQRRNVNWRKTRKSWRPTLAAIAYAQKMRGVKTQKEIAAVLGCSQMTVSNILRGRCDQV